MRRDPEEVLCECVPYVHPFADPFSFEDPWEGSQGQMRLEVLVA